MCKADRIRLSVLGLCALAVVLTAAMAVTGAYAQDKPQADIVDTASKAGNFKTLVAAVQAAGLVDTLKGPGPFTVFAPTDAAFEKLPAGTVESLLKPENKAKLVSILTYHVVSGKMMAADVLKNPSLKTIQGQQLTVEMKDGKPYVGGAQISATDISASNGVIHVIDTVLMPK